MSWASERLQYLSERFSYRQIHDYTGIPISTLSYVIRGERALGAQYILNVRSFYTKSIYAELRASGLSASIARSYRWMSVTHATQYLGEAVRVIEELAQYRLPQYREYLISKGKYINDNVTLDILRGALRKSMAQSPIDLGRDEGKDSPSLRHFIVSPDK